jgi:hypothetical protein
VALGSLVYKVRWGVQACQHISIVCLHTYAEFILNGSPYLMKKIEHTFGNKTLARGYLVTRQLGGLTYQLILIKLVLAGTEKRWSRRTKVYFRPAGEERAPSCQTRSDRSPRVLSACKPNLTWTKPGFSFHRQSIVVLVPGLVSRTNVSEFCLDWSWSPPNAPRQGCSKGRGPDPMMTIWKLSGSCKQLSMCVKI